MNRSRHAKFYVAAILALAGTAAADELPYPPRTSPPAVGFLDAAKPMCWARTYDSAHMAAHPKQKVTAIAVSYVVSRTVPEQAEPVPMWDPYSSVPAFSAILAVTMKGHTKTLLAGIYCTETDDANRLDCGVEADGGSFTLIRRPDGKVRLDNPTGFTVGDGEEEGDSPGIDSDTVLAQDDQEAFLLAESKGGLCDADFPPAP